MAPTWRADQPAATHGTATGDVDRSGEAEYGRGMCSSARRSFEGSRLLFSEFHFTQRQGALLGQRQYAAAETELRKAWDIRSTDLGSDNADSRDVTLELTQLYRASGRDAEAAAWDAHAAPAKAADAPPPAQRSGG